MFVVNIIEPCYHALQEIKANMIAEKKARGEPTKTTHSEILCMFIKEYRKNHNDSAEMLGGEEVSPITLPASSHNDQR